MTQTYTPTPPTTSTAPGSLRLLLLAVWAVATLGALLFVAVVGTNAPYADEWEFVPALVGEEPVLPWLWQQHNEHRLPLPRAIFLGLFKLTHDFRAGMVLQVAVLSALALYLMRLAARLRGRPHWADCFFPVSLLHTGHWENFVMGYQVCFVLFAVFATGLAVVAMQITRENAFRSGVLAGVLLMLLALTGGSGLAVVPAVAAWLAFVALTLWRDSYCGAGGAPASSLEAGGTPAPQRRAGAKGKALLVLLLAVLPVAYLAVYFVNYHKPPDHPPLSRDPLAIGPVTAAVLALAPGVGLSGVWWAVFAGELALGVGTIVLLVQKRPREPLSTAGLIAVAAGVAGVALAIGLARADWGTARILQFARYSVLTWPLLATAYLVWARAGRKWVPIGLCVAAALAFPGNTGTGIVNAAVIKSKYSAIEADVAAELSAEQIVKRQFPDSHQAGQEDRAVTAIPLLRRARIGIFAR